MQRVHKKYACNRDEFYVPENADYTIVDSAIDSVRFTVERTLAPCSCGHVSAISSFVDPEGNPMTWHDFGQIEGPGWAANAVGGAHEIYQFGRFLRRLDWQQSALKVLGHVLDHGFLDPETGFIHGYRKIPSNELFLNYQSNSEWLCPGSMARIAFQLVTFAGTLEDDPLAARMQAAAVKCAAWINEHVASVPNGWFPRRCTPNGVVYIGKQAGHDDPLWQTSADGLFILQLQTELTRRGLAEYTAQVAQKTDVFINAGGIFGSINHDTYDPHENVAYSVAFRTLRQVARILGREDIKRFAFERCLAGLDRFQMREDRNGVQTTGLLYMEDTWDTAYLWENAEAAAAYFEATSDLRDADPETSRRYELTGLTILRAMARHHYGPHGFLTEGVDWNNHVGQQHHIDQTAFGAIRYTEPFLNNQHLVEPTLIYLEHLASTEDEGGERRWRDCEGNVIYRKATRG
ncbi:MAG: hypothetical protein HY706_10205 [Candidatus Hydrogenedentes bacterium]|nr:hypothetical protein [Candidatus Hydrogenedentota bacterium]